MRHLVTSHAASGSSWIAFALASSAASQRPVNMSAPDRAFHVSGAVRFKFTALLVTSSHASNQARAVDIHIEIELFRRTPQ